MPGKNRPVFSHPSNLLLSMRAQCGHLMLLKMSQPSVGSFPFKNHSLLRHPEKCAKDKVGETYFWMGLNLILICLTQMD